MFKKINAWFINHRRKDKDFKTEENQIGTCDGAVIYTNDYYKWDAKIAETDSNLVTLIMFDHLTPSRPYYNLFNTLGFRWLFKLDETHDYIILAGNILQYEELILDLYYNSGKKDDVLCGILISAIRTINHNGFHTKFLKKFNIAPIDIELEICKEGCANNIEYKEGDTSKIICYDSPEYFMPVDFLQELCTMDELRYLCTIEYVDENGNMWNLEFRDFIDGIVGDTIAIPTYLYEILDYYIDSSNSNISIDDVKNVLSSYYYLIKEGIMEFNSENNTDDESDDDEDNDSLYTDIDEIID